MVFGFHRGARRKIGIRPGLRRVCGGNFVCAWPKSVANVTATRHRLYCAIAAGAGLVVTAAGEVVVRGTVPELCEAMHACAVDVLLCDTDALTAVVDAYIAAGYLSQLDVALRGTGTSGAPVPLSLRCAGWPCRWLDARAQLPDGDLTAAAVGLGVPMAGLGGDTALTAAWWSRLHCAWLQLCDAEGIALKITLASTAAAIGIPRQWRTAYQATARTGDLWATVRRAYYGGRVACLQPGWHGQAVEYDLRNAYGWALTQPLPDWKIYDRRPLPSQPAWYDATVELAGHPLGPLPWRSPDAPLSLQWPTAGTLRAVWTRMDIERAEQAGCRVVQLHRQLSGRWSRDLAPTVEKWLEKRSVATDPMLRALYKALPNCLAGKLCQKSTGWVLWAAGGDLPPVGAVPLGMDSAAWAVPVVALRQPVTCPQAGSYVTALVRGRVWPELQRADAIYSDTDSIHLPADAPPPADCGDAPGQWRASAAGLASYYGPKKYIVGAKNVNAQRHLRAPTGATIPAAECAPVHGGKSRDTAKGVQSWV